jgi:hypothetical protein
MKKARKPPPKAPKSIPVILDEAKLKHAVGGLHLPGGWDVPVTPGQ